jgi:H+/gluconate symporter-like permease
VVSALLWASLAAAVFAQGNATSPAPSPSPEVIAQGGASNLFSDTVLMIGVAVGSFLLSALFAWVLRSCTAEVKQHSVSLKGAGKRHGKSSGLNRGKRGTAAPGAAVPYGTEFAGPDYQAHHKPQASAGALSHLELQDEDD